MNQIEGLERQLRQQQAHIAAIGEALTRANRENVQLRAQVKAVAESGTRHLQRATELIDALHNRIEAMVDEWQAQIRDRFTGSEGDRAALLEAVEAFRPQRVARAIVEPATAP